MLKPLRDNVLLKPHQQEEQLESGLFVPGTREKRFMKGTVLAVGPGRLSYDRWVDVAVKPGDVVLYDTDYALDSGERYEGDTVMLCPESALLAKE